METKNVAGEKVIKVEAEARQRTAYRKPEVRNLGGLEQVQGRITGREYDGPARYYFNGF
jgi:hypothetical protein